MTARKEKKADKPIVRIIHPRWPHNSFVFVISESLCSITAICFVISRSGSDSLFESIHLKCESLNKILCLGCHGQCPSWPVVIWPLMICTCSCCWLLRTCRRSPQRRDSRTF